LKDNSLIPHLFRSEFSKIVSVLCKTFGLSNIQLAEDITSETFLKATETWGIKGIPDNPTAWLYKVAKNKAKDYFKREQVFVQKIIPELKHQKQSIAAFDLDLSEHNIQDSQLQMLFTVCNPIISKEAQITFALRVLCGFGIEEISKALLSNKATINKRLHRIKETFRKNKVDLTFPSEDELMNRLNNVLSVLYLLFNEGYYSTTSEKTIKKELCIESMRLLYMLLNYEPSNQPHVNALMALFCFHSSRFEARMDQNGELILYDDQDKEKWNFELIEKGEFYIKRSSAGNEITKYYLEALIAFWHTRIDADIKEKWENILQLYNQLIQIEYSPVTALNRTYALAMTDGKEKAIKEALKINLSQNHLYHTLLAELYDGGNHKKQIEHLQLALKLADTENERKVILKKLNKANS
jgi:RNA polymerase sigma-70 factor (ECF subfamily)